MLLLTSTSDQLQVVTSAAVSTVHVHATWVDTLGTTVTPGRTNTNVTTAATTSVSGSPAASTQRNVKTLHVRNSSTTPCDVTVQHTDGSTTVRLAKVTLFGGDMVQMTDQGGFLLL